LRGGWCGLSFPQIAILRQSAVGRARPWPPCAVAGWRGGGKRASPIRLLPEVSLALPLAVVFLRGGLLATPLGVILPSLIMALPVAAWMLSTTLSTIRS